MSPAKRNVKQLLNGLTYVADVARVMVDADVAYDVITEKAMEYVTNEDPKLRNMANDYYNVEYEPFMQIKRTLMRLERLVDFPCNTALWIKVKDKLTVVVQNGKTSRYYRFGWALANITEELGRCLKTGDVQVLDSDNPTQPLTVLAPAYDSLGDIVGVVEVSTLHPATPNPHAMRN